MQGIAYEQFMSVNDDAKLNFYIYKYVKYSELLWRQIVLLKIHLMKQIIYNFSEEI